jgi:protease PrsW
MTIFTKRWFQVLIAGVILFFGIQYLLTATKNISLLFPLLILGAFVVPLSFVTFFYGEERLLDKNIHGGTPLKTAAVCFFVGGLIGVIVASVLEYGTLNQLNVGSFFIVAIIEEGAKLIFPIIVFIRSRHLYRSEIDGLLFGTASGMGFAALETLGYGVVTFLQSNGSIGETEQILLVRGLISPVGHAAWTGIICAALWHKREQTKSWFNPAVIGVYFLAVVLHSSWDTIALINLDFIVYLGFLVIAVISLTLLIRRNNEAKRASQHTQ